MVFGTPDAIWQTIGHNFIICGPGCQAPSGDFADLSDEGDAFSADQEDRFVPLFLAVTGWGSTRQRSSFASPTGFAGKILYNLQLIEKTDLKVIAGINGHCP
ncbi:MAG: hypothetical protein U5K99_06395 [Anaerolineales bacterium]|nr:hypothetical protein [Anaerolineales bacterium]